MSNRTCFLVVGEHTVTDDGPPWVHGLQPKLGANLEMEGISCFSRSFASIGALLRLYLSVWGHKEEYPLVIGKGFNATSQVRDEGMCLGV